VLAYLLKNGYSVQLKHDNTEDFRSSKVGFVEVKAADGTELFSRDDYQKNPHYRAKEAKAKDFVKKFENALAARGQN